MLEAIVFLCLSFNAKFPECYDQVSACYERQREIEPDYKPKEVVKLCYGDFLESQKNDD